jgi:hypothetical protein
MRKTVSIKEFFTAQLSYINVRKKLIVPIAAERAYVVHVMEKSKLPAPFVKGQQNAFNVMELVNILVSIVMVTVNAQNVMMVGVSVDIAMVKELFRVLIAVAQATTLMSLATNAVAVDIMDGIRYAEFVVARADL